MTAAPAHPDVTLNDLFDAAGELGIDVVIEAAHSALVTVWESIAGVAGLDFDADAIKDKPLREVVSDFYATLLYLQAACAADDPEGRATS